MTGLPFLLTYVLGLVPLLQYTRRLDVLERISKDRLQNHKSIHDSNRERLEHFLISHNILYEQDCYIAGYFCGYYVSDRKLCIDVIDNSKLGYLDQQRIKYRLRAFSAADYIYAMVYNPTEFNEILLPYLEDNS